MRGIAHSSFATIWFCDASAFTVRKHDEFCAPLKHRHARRRAPGGLKFHCWPLRFSASFALLLIGCYALLISSWLHRFLDCGRFGTTVLGGKPGGGVDRGATHNDLNHIRDFETMGRWTIWANMTTGSISVWTATFLEFRKRKVEKENFNKLV